MKILSVLGARPQFIKAAPFSLAVKNSEHSEYIVHTGQHYDFEMSEIFFQELDIPPPALNLNIGSGSHGEQTGQMLIALEKTMQEQNPDVVLVYGDTNSTLAGALAAVKLGIRIAHVEAGLRSFNRTMPEEHNRVLTDHTSDLLFCPTQTAVTNLKHEGRTDNIFLVGDTMKDAVRIFGELAEIRSRTLADLALEPGQYLLATVHRPYNTDKPGKLRAIFRALEQAPLPVVLPIHPRTQVRLDALPDFQIDPDQVRIISPVGYLDMLKLLRNAATLLTDSGGMQKEAYFAGVRCITLRPETEWVETLTDGWNTLTGTDESRILEVLREPFAPNQAQPNVFGDGHAAEQILDVLAR